MFFLLPYFCLIRVRMSLTKRAGSGSVSRLYGSAAPQHWFLLGKPVWGRKDWKVREAAHNCWSWEWARPGTSSRALKNKCLLYDTWANTSSVSVTGSLSRILDPDFYPSRISDSRSNNSNKVIGGKLLSYFFMAKNFTKQKNILLLNTNRYRKKFDPIDKRIRVPTFYPKIHH